MFDIFSKKIMQKNMAKYFLLSVIISNFAKIINSHTKHKDKMSEEIMERELEVYDIDGQEYYIEDKIELDGKTYCSLYPYYETEAEMENAPENIGVYIMEYVKEDCSIAGIENDELYNKVEQIFKEMDEALNSANEEEA